MKARLSCGILFVLFLLMSGFSTTYASGFSVGHINVLGAGGSCSANGFVIGGGIDYDLDTTGPQFALVSWLNGKVIAASNGIFPYSGKGSVTNFPSFIAPQNFAPGSDTYSYSLEQTYAYNNLLFEIVDFSFDCVAGIPQNKNLVYTVVAFPAAFIPQSLDLYYPKQSAPPLPAGFVLRTITCDTPLYDRAGGQTIAGGAAVSAGQTWYVSPTPVDADGRSWTELFAGGYSDGFLPASCVGGAPAGY